MTTIRPVDQEKVIIKTIYKNGNGLSIYLPKKLIDYGFYPGAKVEINIEDNQVVLRPLTSRSYRSAIKELHWNGRTFTPIIEKDHKSGRYEDRLLKKLSNEDVIIISFDHFLDKLILLYFIRKQKHWHVKYITEDILTKIKNGHDPLDLLGIN
jgi:antitoxin component of MazEF toxin-antitoxin module